MDPSQENRACKAKYRFKHLPSILHYVFIEFTADTSHVTSYFHAKAIHTFSCKCCRVKSIQLLHVLQSVPAERACLQAGCRGDHKSKLRSHLLSYMFDNHIMELLLLVAQHTSQVFPRTHSTSHPIWMSGLGVGCTLLLPGATVHCAVYCMPHLKSTAARG